MTKLSSIRIILFEPLGALNVGSTARVMKNMGLENLILVNPQCEALGEEARKMAVHGVDVLEKAQQVATLPEALVGCQRAIATTGYSRTLGMELETPKQALPWLIAENINSALIFGREDRGLSNIELNYAQRFIGIPANPEYSSLNLAQAVAICAYELYQLVNEQAQSELKDDKTMNLASLENVESYYQHLESLLLKIGYLYPHTATARMKKIRRLYNRINLSQEELAMLRGILSQMEWVSGLNGNQILGKL